MPSTIGARRIAADPVAYLSTLVILVGPLLLILAAPGLISLAPWSPKTGVWMLVASMLGGAAALITAYAGFVVSYAVLCTGANPTAGQDAQCTASSGVLAAVFGVVGPIMVLPPLLALLRRGMVSTASETPPPHV